MHITFKRTIHPKTLAGLEPVEASVSGTNDGKTHHFGVLRFPGKLAWTRFIGAMQRGAVGMRDMDISIENVPYQQPTGQGGSGDAKPK